MRNSDELRKIERKNFLSNNYELKKISVIKIFITSRSLEIKNEAKF